jgi:1,2-diacylglycerol 3-beta-galactosyltransferase
MGNPPTRPAHLLFLFSDTGGGHRSAAEAIIEALGLEFGECITTEMVDIFKEYAPMPMDKLPELYPQMVRLPQAWGLGFKLSDGSHRAQLITASTWPYVRTSMRRMIASHPSDLVVSVHPLANAPALRALGRRRPPYITVVTDLVTAHALWYHRNADLTIVPTQEAFRRAIVNGLQPEKVQVVGLPVADRFCQPPGERAALRRQLGWPQERVLILLVGGGEGMGPLERTAHAIAAGCPQAALAIIAGRNQALKERLEAYAWEIPTFIYGFTRQMPDFMQEADILVTKAGPGTISEALIAGLPMVLYSRLPGQEDGNIRYVAAEGAGIWAPKPEQIVAALSTWIERPDKRQQAAAACRRLARPQAARQIAHILAERVGVTIPQEVG